MNSQTDRFSQVFTSIFKAHTEYKLKKLAEMGLENLSLSQFKYLEAIHELDTPSFSKIAEHFNISKPAVTFAVEKLINLEMVKKVQSSSDRRVFIIILTPKGEEIVAVYLDANAHFQKMVKDKLSDSEYNTLLNLLEKAAE